VVLDPSHATGKRNLVIPVALAGHCWHCSSEPTDFWWKSTTIPIVAMTTALSSLDFKMFEASCTTFVASAYLEKSLPAPRRDCLIRQLP